MPGVERQAGESIESLLKRFRRELSQSGQLRDYRRRQRFISRGELKREKQRRALRRIRRRSTSRLPSGRPGRDQY
jgi:ribosomal protein S21